MKEVWPNLFIPGAGKSGTTSLHFYLNQHPDIWMSKDKEPGYFCDHGEDKTKRKYYLSLFTGGKYCKYRGESSTGYMMSDITMRRIKKDIHNPKFIFILRNPVDRAYSHYSWLKGIGFESFSFEEAFLQDKERAFATKEVTPVGDKSYFQGGCYGKWLTQYCNFFGKENIHVITNEELNINPLKTLNTCFDFLSLEKLDALQEISKNQTKILTNPGFYHKAMLLLSQEGDNALKDLYKKILPDSVRIKLRRLIIACLEIFKNRFARSKPVLSITKAQREWIAKYYTEDVKILKKVIEKDFSHWSDFIE